MHGCSSLLERGDAMRDSWWHELRSTFSTTSPPFLAERKLQLYIVSRMQLVFCYLLNIFVSFVNNPNLLWICATLHFLSYSFYKIAFSPSLLIQITFSRICIFPWIMRGEKLNKKRSKMGKGTTLTFREERKKRGEKSEILPRSDKDINVEWNIDFLPP